MPTNRTRRARLRMERGPTPVECYALMHGTMPPHAERSWYPGKGMAAWRLSHPLDRTMAEFRAAWDSVREALLDECEPGTRPFAWWLLEAPRTLLQGERESGPEPRRHVGGSGRPIQAGYASWLAKRKGILAFENVDPHHPPLVESEAAFLRRHRLLRRGEASQLCADAYKPVAVLSDDQNVA